MQRELACHYSFILMRERHVVIWCGFHLPIEFFAAANVVCVCVCVGGLMFLLCLSARQGRGVREIPKMKCMSLHQYILVYVVHI